MSDTHAETVAYVRDSMVEQREPPLSQSGAYKWIHQNMLSTPLNVILTVVSLWVIWAVLSHLLPWAVFGMAAQAGSGDGEAWLGGKLVFCSVSEADSEIGSTRAGKCSNSKSTPRKIAVLN